jgi:AraC-like DNA-binding protein
MITTIIIGISIAVFTSIIFLSKRSLTSNDKIIAVFMVFLAMPMLEKLVLMKVIDIPYLNFSVFFGSALTFGPFLYLYAFSAVNPDSHFKIKSLVHFIPFVISMFLLLLHGQNMSPQNIPTGGIDNNSFKSIVPGIEMRSVINAFIMLSLVVYTVLVFTLLRAHRRNIPNYFSYDSFVVNLKWLNWITVCFIIAYGFVFLSAQGLPEFIGMPLLDPRIAPDVGTSFFIFAFSFCAIKQPLIFKERPGQPAAASSRDAEGLIEKKYLKSGLKESDAQKYLTLLEECMRAEKLYRDPDLTIVDVASKLNIPKHYITQIINEKTNKNFYQYINEYRINEVKRKIADKKFSGHSVLRIAFESGFNSKSSFNTVFKKMTNNTPSEYKKMVQP